MHDKVKAVTLMGNGASRDGAFYVGELWSVNSGYKNISGIPISRAFMLHDLKCHDGSLEKGGDYKDLIGTDTRVIGIEDHPEFEIERYPFEDVEAFFEVAGYYTSSIDYMIAMAVMEGYNSITLVGIDFHPMDAEHNWAKESATFWVGMALGKGAKVYNTNGSFLCKIPEGVCGDYARIGLRDYPFEIDMPIYANNKEIPSLITGKVRA